MAVIVGANAGTGERSPLRYAETDAGKVAQTLVELGGLDPADLFLLQGRPLSSLREVLDLARRRVAGWHEVADTRVVLIFYFSGHSDGEALELGRERLGFGELRRWLGSTGAEVRLAIVDSCKSGALLAAKGGSPGPAFQIRLTDELSSSGEALLTSSAADELALESREIRGSFFTHHLVSGLRGAADSSGDGNVTLAEAYQYAYARTLAATSGTLIGPQHPVYDYRLSGQGELVLSALARPMAALELPAGFERVLVVHLVRDQVLAEIPAGAALRVVVPPGDYAVRAWRTRRDLRRPGQRARRRDAAGARRGAARVAGDAGEHQGRRAGGGGDRERPAAAARACAVLRRRHAGRDRRGRRLARVGAAGRAHAQGLRPVPRGRHLHRPRRELVETSALIFGGYRFGLAGVRLSGFIGLEVGGGLVSQNLDAGGAGRSATLLFAPWLGGALRVSSGSRSPSKATSPSAGSAATARTPSRCYPPAGSASWSTSNRQIQINAEAHRVRGSLMGRTDPTHSQSVSACSAGSALIWL